MDVRNFNRTAWDRKVKNGNRWTIPVNSDEITAAKQGLWKIFLTPSKAVPRAWLPDLDGLDMLCLASGGGQQGPILAAAGAQVTVFDNSPSQLAQDRFVAERERLNIATFEGDMRDLSVFSDESFDLIVHPVSNCFVPEVKKVWMEAYRVLRNEGELLSGFINPVDYLFDEKQSGNGIYQLKYNLPYSDLSSLSKDERTRIYGKDAPIEFGHSLEDQIGGQLDVGFVLTGFYEDYRKNEKISEYITSFIATRAIKVKT